MDPSMPSERGLIDPAPSVEDVNRIDIGSNESDHDPDVTIALDRSTRRGLRPHGLHLHPGRVRLDGFGQVRVVGRVQPACAGCREMVASAVSVGGNIRCLFALTRDRCPGDLLRF
jgi:hypothetical protein